LSEQSDSAHSPVVPQPLMVNASDLASAMAWGACCV
jgi:hypothetical protein